MMDTAKRHIVVGVDGSKESENALEWAGSVSEPLGAEVIAVYGLTPLSELVMSLPPFPPEDWRDEAATELEREWCAPLRERGVAYRSEVVEANPVTALLEVSRRERAELIVVGGHHHASITDHIVGSLSTQLVHRGDTPIVVVPPAA